MNPTTESLKLGNLHKGVLFGIAFVLLIVGGLYYGYYKKGAYGLKSEPVPTVENFRKNYVPGCELTPMTFSFVDGATLSGEFAACTDSSNRFFSTTTSSSIPKKGTIKVHSILEEVNGVTSVVVSVFMPVPEGMFNANFNAKFASSTPAERQAMLKASNESINLSDITTYVVPKNELEQGRLSFGMQSGYVMGLYSKGKGFRFNQSTLKYSPPAR